MQQFVAFGAVGPTGFALGMAAIEKSQGKGVASVAVHARSDHGEHAQQTDGTGNNPDNPLEIHHAENMVYRP